MTLFRPDPGFFVGYFKTMPLPVRRVMVVFALFFVAGLASASVVLSLSSDHPGSGAYVDELGDGHLTGLLETRPYPILRLAAIDGRPARAIMMANPNKSGVEDVAAALTGRTVDAGGIFVKRGDLDMLLIGGQTGLRMAEKAGAANAPSPAVSLGRWRLTGEICDGKCYGGAMRPGQGLAHKACANLCISGGIPPVFVTTSPVEGHSFLLMAGADGGPLPDIYLKRTAVLMELEGTVERRDDLLIFRVDRAQPGRHS